MTLRLLLEDTQLPRDQWKTNTHFQQMLLALLHESAKHAKKSKPEGCFQMV